MKSVVGLLVVLGVCVILGYVEAQQLSPFGAWVSNSGFQPALNDLKAAPGFKAYPFHSNGRYMRAIKPIQSGELIVAVPLSKIGFHSHLVESEFPREILQHAARTIPELTEADVLVMSLIYHRFILKADSYYHPYLTTLPDEKVLKTQMVYWSDDAVKECPAGLNAVKAAREALTQRKLKVREVCFSIAQHFNSTQDICSIDNINWAMAIVFSRSWSVGRGFGSILLPYIDSFDHKSSGPGIKIVDQNDDPEIRPDSKESRQWFAKVYADRDYAAGEELFINYHGSPNATITTSSMVTNYGFLPEKEEWSMKLLFQFKVSSFFDHTIQVLRQSLGCPDVASYEINMKASGAEVLSRMMKCLRAESITPSDLERLSSGAVGRNTTLDQIFSSPINIESEYRVMKRLTRLLTSHEEGFPNALETDNQRLTSGPEAGDIKLIIALRMSSKLLLQHTQNAVLKKWTDLLARD